MAINKYTSAAQYVPESLYVPVPLDFLNNQLQRKQQQYDLGLNDINATNDIFNKVKARSQDIGALQSIRQAYDTELNNITDAANGDIGSSQWRENFNKVKRRLASDMTSGDLYAINANYQNFQDWNKRVLEEKDNYNPYLDTAYGRISDPFYTGYKNADGTYNIATPGAINKQVNRTEAADAIVKGIADDAIKFKNGNIGTDIKVIPDQNGNLHIRTTDGKEVSPEKIRNTFRSAFRGSEAMSQIMREADFRAATEGVDREQFVERSLEDLENFVISKYSGRDVSSKLSIHNLPEWQSDQNTAAVLTPTQNGSAFRNPNAAAKLEEPGTQVGSMFKDTKLSGYSSAKVGITNDYDLENLPSQRAENKALFDQQVNSRINRINSTLTALGNTNPNRKSQFEQSKFTPKEYVAAFNKGVENIQNITLTGEQISSDQADVYSDMLNRSKASKLYNVGGKQMTINQIAEENGVSPEEVKVNPSLIHYDSVDPSLVGGNLEVSIDIKDKPSMAGITTLNDNFTKATEVISIIGQNSIYKGVDVFTEDNKFPYPELNAEIHTVTIPKKSFKERDVPFMTRVIITPIGGGEPLNVDYLEFKEIIADRAKTALGSVKSGASTMTNKDIKR